MGKYETFFQLQKVYEHKNEGNIYAFVNYMRFIYSYFHIIIKNKIKKTFNDYKYREGPYMWHSSEDNEGNKINIYLTKNNINDILKKKKLKLKQ